MQSPDLMTLSTVAICPTSRSAPAASFHPAVDIAGTKTTVMCEMVTAIDARKLTSQVDHLSLEDIRAVDAALELVLDLGR